MELRKILTLPEAKYRYLQIRKHERNFFPEKFEVFKLKFKEQTYELRVNNRDCVIISQLYQEYRFSDGEEIIITKKNGNYELSLIE